MELQVRNPTGPKARQSEGEKSYSYKRPTCPKARKSDNPLGRKPASPKMKTKAHKSKDPIVRRPMCANFPGVATQTPVQASHIRRSLWVPPPPKISLSRSRMVLKIFNNVYDSKFRTSDISDQWDFGQVGFQTSGLSD
jgi:hypothetical protein